MKLFTIFLSFLMIEGCAMFQGGMPPVPTELEKDIGVAKKELEKFATVKIYYENPSIEARNKYITVKLLKINYNYLKYIRRLTSEESIIHSASEILILGLNASATGIAVESTKTLLSGLSTVVGGTTLSLNKNAFHEKSMAALVSGMNANRKEVLVRILSGMGTPLDKYPLENAISDLNDYYQAGTLNSAIATLQMESGVKELSADKKIETILLQRGISFLDKDKQLSIEALINSIKELSDSEVLDLVMNSPTSTEKIDQLIAIKDKDNQRKTNPAIAREILLMQIALIERSPENLEKWSNTITKIRNTSEED